MLVIWASVPTSWRRFNNSFPFRPWIFFSGSELDTVLGSVPSSFLTRKAPAYGIDLLRFSTKACNSFGSFTRIGM
uniref:Uncharacterized protein n=1 Tax=Arundo donax TaxID=35708 RepID=A0A0A9CZF0_ARUDO